LRPAGLGDIYGKHRLLVVALGLLSLDTLFRALADSLGVMLVGRVLQGAGGGVFPLSFAIVRDELPRAKMPGAIALLSAMLGTGGAVGLVVAGAIVEDLSLLGITQADSWLWLGQEHRFRDRWRGAAARLCALRAARPRPLVDMKVMAQRGVWTTNAVTLFVGFGMFAGIVLVPTAALYIVPNALAMLLVGPVAARLAAARGAKVPALLGVGLTSVAYMMLAVAHGTHAEVVAGLVVQGLGIGLAFASLANLIVEAVPQHQTRAATWSTPSCGPSAARSGPRSPRRSWPRTRSPDRRSRPSTRSPWCSG
jgi:MFS family permease